MKAKLYKLPFPPNTSFLYRNLDRNHIEDPWHFHKEYELLLINKGNGTRFVGDNVSLFESGDLTLIGSDIPHLFRNDKEYYVRSNNLTVNLIYIHFRKDFLGENFFDIPEMKMVNGLLEKASLALEIHGNAKKEIIKRLIAMNNEKPEERLMSLLHVLIKLSNSRSVKPISSTRFVAKSTDDNVKINLAFEFILKNYTEQIYVNEIALKLNMSVSAFSRYFKQHTRKTFSDYVTELRISHACKLLMDDNHSISQISFLSGFENLSNFYRHFKKIIGVVPKEYRNQFLKISE